MNSENHDNRKKPLWKRLLPVAISLLFIGLIYSKTNLSSLLETLSTISLETAFAIASLYAFGQLVSAAKWRIFVSSIGMEKPYLETARAYFFGMFVNTFALGTVGGDVARSLALRPPKGKRAAAIATSVADRVQGLGVLLTIGAIGIIFVKPEALGPLAVPLAWLCVLSLALGWLIGPKILTRVFPKDHRFGRSAREVKNAFPRDPKLFVVAAAISVFFHFVQIYMHYVIAYELGASVLSFAFLIATVPLVNVAAAMPISINGLGVREAMYIFLFVPHGVSQEVAVAFGAIWILAVTAVSAVGGLVVAWSGGVDRGTIEAEAADAQPTADGRQPTAS